MRGPRGGPSENRVRLAPRFRRPLRTFPHPWWLHERELRAIVSIAATCREHVDRGGALVPPSLSASVSQSVNQRWRERPRCPALHGDPRPWRRGRSRHRWSCRISLSARAVSCRTNAPPACTSSCRRFRRNNTARRIEQKSVRAASQCFPGRSVAFADPDPGIAPSRL